MQAGEQDHCLQVGTKKNSALHTPAVGSDGHQLNRGAHTPAGNHTHAHNCSITYYAPMMLVE